MEVILNPKNNLLLILKWNFFLVNHSNLGNSITPKELETVKHGLINS
jgi:hypothetical protein